MQKGARERKEGFLGLLGKLASYRKLSHLLSSCSKPRHAEPCSLLLSGSHPVENGWVWTSLDFGLSTISARGGTSVYWETVAGFVTVVLPGRLKMLGCNTISKPHGYRC